MIQWLKRLFRRLGQAGSGRILCDNCKYDYPSACNHPERPNATRCDDYKAK